MLHAVSTLLLLSVFAPRSPSGLCLPSAAFPEAPPCLAIAGANEVLAPAGCFSPQDRVPESRPAVGNNPQGKAGGPGQPAPEPAAFLLVGTGLLGLALSRRWRRRLP